MQQENNRINSPLAYLRPLYIHPWPQATARIPHSFLLPASWEKILVISIHNRAMTNQAITFLKVFDLFCDV